LGVSAQLSTNLRDVTVGASRQHAGGGGGVRASSGGVGTGPGKLLAEPAR
jgi:hypothetical protein